MHRGPLPVGSPVFDSLRGRRELQFASWTRGQWTPCALPSSRWSRRQGWWANGRTKLVFFLFLCIALHRIDVCCTALHPGFLQVVAVCLAVGGCEQRRTLATQVLDQPSRAPAHELSVSAALSRCPNLHAVPLAHSFLFGRGKKRGRKKKERL